MAKTDGRMVFILNDFLLANDTLEAENREQSRIIHSKKKKEGKNSVFSW